MFSLKQYAQQIRKMNSKQPKPNIDKCKYFLLSMREKFLVCEKIELNKFWKYCSCLKIQNMVIPSLYNPDSFIQNSLEYYDNEWLRFQLYNGKHIVPKLEFFSTEEYLNSKRVCYFIEVV